MKEEEGEKEPQKRTENGGIRSHGAMNWGLGERGRRALHHGRYRKHARGGEHGMAALQVGCRRVEMGEGGNREDRR